MAGKTRRGPAAKGTLDLDTILQALRGDDALVILRRLADRDPEWAKVIESMAKDLLSAVDADDVAAEVLAELDSLSVEDVWDRAGPLRISAIVDACFSLIVDGETASSRARRGVAQAPGLNVAQSSTISLKPPPGWATMAPVLGLN
jgi:hypothetical protein